MTKDRALLALATAALTACEQNRGITNPAAAIAASLQAQRLTALGPVGGLPTGTRGLAAF